jgi:hypothetical protein
LFFIDKPVASFVVFFTQMCEKYYKGPLLCYKNFPFALQSKGTYNAVVCQVFFENVFISKKTYKKKQSFLLTSSVALL